MCRKSHSKQLYCSMNNILVGVLKLNKGRMSFEYDPQWLSAIGTRALSLSLPLQSSEIKSDAVHAYFDNLLPDNDVIRKHMVDRLGTQSTSPFDLLATRYSRQGLHRCDLFNSRTTTWVPTRHFTQTSQRS